MLSTKTYFQVTGFIFAIVGLAHLIRVLSGWTIVIGGWNVPIWISYIGVLGPWYLSYNAFKHSK